MMRFPIATAALLSCLFKLVLVGATITDPLLWPGLIDLPICVQNVFAYCTYACDGCIPCYVGCGDDLPADWICACNQFPSAISAVSSVAATGCSGSQTDISAATSIVNGFCGQLLATSTVSEPTAPTLVPTLTSVPTASSTSGGDTFGGNGSGDGGGGGLSTGEKIALGVGIGLGLPGATWAIWQMCIRIQRHHDLDSL